MRLLPLLLCCLPAMIGGRAAAQSGQPPVSPLLAPLAQKVFTSDPARAPAVSPTRFRPSPRNLAAMVGGLTADEEKRRTLTTLLQNVFAAYEEGAKKAGCENDLAGALAFYIATGFAAYQGGAVADTGTDQMVRQIQIALDSPEMRAASDSDKQQLYDTFIMLAGLLTARVQTAAGDPAAVKELKPLGAQALQTLLKAEPSRIRITGEGLRLAAAAGGPAAPTLLFSAPPGWTRTDKSDGVSIETHFDDFYNAASASVLILQAIPASGKLQDAFRRFWKDVILPGYEGHEQPFVMLQYVGKGLRAAFVQEDVRSRKTGGYARLSAYLVDGGSQRFPVVVFQSGLNKAQDAAVSALMKSLAVPGGNPPKQPLATNSQLARLWSHSKASAASYVTSTGAYAGDASVAYGETYDLKPDGTYRYSFLGTGSGRVTRGKGKGKYRLEGDMLILTDSTRGGKVTRLRFLGIDAAPDGKGPMMLLLNPEYALSSGNIGLYGQRYRPDSR